jgi:hypothetical protein
MTETETTATEALAPDPVATRNKLLRVKRQLVEIEAGQRFIRSISDVAPVAAVRKALPASHFVGIDVQIDIARLADALTEDVAELAEVLRETPADQSQA